MQSEDTQEAPGYSGQAGPIVIPLRTSASADETQSDASSDVAAEHEEATTELPQELDAEIAAVEIPEAAAERGEDNAEPLAASAEQCMISSIADHPASGASEEACDVAEQDSYGFLDDGDDGDEDGEVIGLMLVTPKDDTHASFESAADPVGQGYAVLGQSSLDEVRQLEESALAAQAEADPAILRRRALDTLIRSEEEAHDIIETAQRDAASRTTRAELKAKLTLDQARERADLLIASAQARSELLVEEACKNAVFDIEEETRRKSDIVLDDAKSEAKTKVTVAADEARQIVDRARRQSAEIITSAEVDAEERRQAASEMFSAIEALELKVEQDSVIAAEASAQAASEVLDQANADANEMRAQAAVFQTEARSQSDVIVRNAHARSEQIIAGADETAAWFSERVQAREAVVREATEAHVNDLLERAESASLDLLLNARERCNEMIAEAQLTVDRMLSEGRRVAQDLVGDARSGAATEGSIDQPETTAVQIPQAAPGIALDAQVPESEKSFAGMWNKSVDDEALDSFFDDLAERAADEVFSQ